MRVSVTTKGDKYTVIVKKGGKRTQSTGYTLHACVARLANAGVTDYDTIARAIEAQGFFKVIKQW